MSTVLQDLRYAMRTLARSPGLTLAAVLTLGLGIGANTAMFGVVDRLFFRPPAHVIDPDRVVRLYVTWSTPRRGTSTTSIGTYPRYQDFRDHARSLAAVAPHGFSGIDLDVPDVWVPLTAAAQEVRGPDALSKNYFWLSGVIARLRPGVDPAQVVAEGTAIYRSWFAQTHDSTGVLSLLSVHDAAGWRAHGDVKLSVWLAAMCGLVLLIACANVANLLLARAVQRKREIAVRLALGASRGRLTRQLLAESAVLTVLGGGAALLVTLWVGPVLRAALLPDAAAGAALDIRVVLFTSLVVVATTVLAGLAPVFEASAPDLSSRLKSGEREGRIQRTAARAGLLVGQVAL